MPRKHLCRFLAAVLLFGLIIAPGAVTEASAAAPDLVLKAGSSKQLEWGGTLPTGASAVTFEKVSGDCSVTEKGMLKIDDAATGTCVIKATCNDPDATSKDIVVQIGEVVINMAITFNDIPMPNYGVVISDEAIPDFSSGIVFGVKFNQPTATNKNMAQPAFTDVSWSVKEGAAAPITIDPKTGAVLPKSGSTPGATATIVATDISGVSAQCKIAVRPTPESVTPDPKYSGSLFVPLKVDDNKYSPVLIVTKHTVTADQKTNKIVPAQKMLWFSSDPSVVKVDAEGRAYGLKESTSPVTITGYLGSLTPVTMKVYVGKLVTGVTAKLNPSDASSPVVRNFSIPADEYVTSAADFVKNSLPAIRKTVDKLSKLTAFTSRNQSDVNAVKRYIEKLPDIGWASLFVTEIADLKSTYAALKSGFDSGASDLELRFATFKSAFTDLEALAVDDATQVGIVNSVFNAQSQRIKSILGQKLDLAFKPDDATVFDNTAGDIYTLVSSNEDVVRIDKTVGNLVLPVAPGSASVFLYVQGNRLATLTVTVKPEPSQILFNSFYASGKLVVTPKNKPFTIPVNSVPTGSDKSVTWSSSDTGVATVNAKGVVTIDPAAVSGDSTTIIAVGKNGMFAHLDIEVLEASSMPNFVKVDTKEITVLPGDIAELPGHDAFVGTSGGKGGTLAPGFNFAYSSSNERVAGIFKDTDGSMKIVARSPGTTTITCTVDGIRSAKGTFKVTVPNNAIATFSLDKKGITIFGAFDAKTLNIVASPENFAADDIIWKATGGVSITPSADKMSCVVRASGAGTVTVSVPDTRWSTSCNVLYDPG